MAERDLRSELLNTLLTSPHRGLGPLQQTHQKMLRKDPLFYVHLAAWYADRGQVRDHQEMFTALLCLSDFEGHRDTGLALLRRFPPYEVARVVDFIKGREIKKRVAAGTRGGKSKHRMETLKEGLNRNVPRSLRTEITAYLREREASENAFDRAALTARDALKRLYAGLHIKPSPRANAILFTRNPPPGSLAYILKEITRSGSPAEQARWIAEHRLPYRVACTVIRKMSPMVLAALVEVMSPQELINNLASLKRRGAFENRDVKKLIDAKLKAAQKDGRVSAYKAKVAAGAAEADEELADALDRVTESQVRQAGRITRPTALLIDKSGSMKTAIEVGKQLGAMISAASDAPLVAYAFDTVAYPLQPAGTGLADWEKALAGIEAVGGTSCGVALKQMIRKKQWVEQLVMISDEDENTAPLFKEAYPKYAEAAGGQPAVIFVKIGQSCNKLEEACAELGVAPNVTEFRGDYYALPNLIPLLAAPSLGELVMQILDYPLPRRRAARS
jgi:hypothetical protein